MKKITILLLIATAVYSCSLEEFAVNEAFYDNYNGDQYNSLGENPFIDVDDQPVSTFSVDADGGSYANARRFIQQENEIPVDGSVRIEEWINYFELDYPYTDPAHPIGLNGEVSVCPWNEDNKLVRIGLKGKPVPAAGLPASNFVFLIDVSGSMNSDDKLDILKQGFKEMVNDLSPSDRVAIVTYAGSAGVALESTSGDQKTKIKNAIDDLGPGGSTAGAEGIETAYEIAQAHFIEGGNNRIIIGTDGDFNVGTSGTDELIELIEEKRASGVYITVLGVGRGNLNDHMLEQIANNGNGNYEYIDKVEQLRKVFIYEKNKFYTAAKDVKVQVEFNPQNVQAYRLIGYENRVLNEEDFEDDSKDAGEIGLDQNVTALYEIVPNDNPNFKDVPTFVIDFRYKLPDSDISIPMELEIYDEGNNFTEATDYMKFTAGVASFGMLVVDSEYKGTATYTKVGDWLNDASSLPDDHGFKSELRNLVDAVSGL